VRSGNNIFERQVHKLDSADNIRELNIDISANINSDISSGTGSNSDIVHIDFDTEVYAFSRKIAIFFKNNADVQTCITMENSCSVLTACNGPLNIKASPDFSHALYSLKYNEKEWLDSSFPTPGIKSWWNPWLGGLSLSISGISTASILEEKRQSEFVELEDVLGNKWKGIRNVINIEKNELYRGMKVGFYFLMLPGVPVLCCVTGVFQNTGRHYNKIGFYNQCFFKPSEELKESWVMFGNCKNELLKIKAGREQHYISPVSTPMYGSPSRSEKLHVYVNTDMARIEAGVDINLIMAEIIQRPRIMNGEGIFTQPIFLVFSDNHLQAEILKDLNNVKFDSKELKI